MTGVGTYLATATCPAGSVLVGGGTETQGFFGIIFDSFPSKLGVAGTWTGQASANIGDRGSLRVTAICAVGATATAGQTTTLSAELDLGTETPADTSTDSEPEAEPASEPEVPEP